MKGLCQEYFTSNVGIVFNKVAEKDGRFVYDQSLFSVMKLPLASFLSMVLVVSIGSTFAYDRKIMITDGKLDGLIIGDEFSIEGVITEWNKQFTR
ncbi:hypothetical protein K0U27_08705 [archaeon]|nr:hypothetical protein [archaeon]